VILTGVEIEREVRAGRIVIDPFDRKYIEPNSYGFHLADRFLVYTSDVLSVDEPCETTTIRIPEDGLVLEPGRLYLGATKQTMGSPTYAATLYARRSISTLGVWIQFSAPLGHTGAIIPWTLEVACTQHVRVYAGMPFGKIAFWATTPGAVSYGGKYARSTGPTESKFPDEWRREPRR
jgi:dCTP deaminase